MNAFMIPTTYYSPFELIFLKTPPDITEFHLYPNTDGPSIEASEYMKLVRFHLIRLFLIVKESQ